LTRIKKLEKLQKLQNGKVDENEKICELTKMKKINKSLANRQKFGRLKRKCKIGKKRPSWQTLKNCHKL